MFHFREIASSAESSRNHVIFYDKDKAHRNYLEAMFFDTYGEALEFIQNKDHIRLAMYGSFGSYYFMKPTSIEKVAPHRYFVKHRNKNGTYEWIEIDLEYYGEFPPINRDEKDKEN